jgi:hypothetical protein
MEGFPHLGIGWVADVKAKQDPVVRCLARFEKVLGHCHFLENELSSVQQVPLPCHSVIMTLV